MKTGWGRLRERVERRQFSKVLASSSYLTAAGVLTVSAYIAAQMLSDITSLKIALLAGFSIDCGTFIYPLTFTLRDLVHKLLGKAAARLVIIAAGVINVIMAGYLAFIIRLPPDPTWPNQSAFASVLGPVWRIVIASILAEVFSELADTEIYHFWVTRVTTKVQWMRVLLSNAVSVPLDSLIFCWGAFGRWWGLFPKGLPATTVWSIFWANVLVKGVMTLVSLPWIYLVPERKVVAREMA